MDKKAKQLSSIRGSPGAVHRACNLGQAPERYRSLEPGTFTYQLHDLAKVSGTPVSSRANGLPLQLWPTLDTGCCQSLPPAAPPSFLPIFFPIALPPSLHSCSLLSSFLLLLLLPSSCPSSLSSFPSYIPFSFLVHEICSSFLQVDP